ncbi:hypothetical protein O988_03077 [Pseudogymnoascus sp. VKM F-3808]|nr:hypothetical protein O988_03077 [Pseudogymnoascus sp. VKM F-3808]
MTSLQPRLRPPSAPKNNQSPSTAPIVNRSPEFMEKLRNAAASRESRLFRDACFTTTTVWMSAEEAVSGRMGVGLWDCTAYEEW